MTNPKKPPVDKGTTAISIRLPTDLQEQAKQKSELTGVPISFVVRKALEEWVKKREIFVSYDPDYKEVDEAGPFAPNKS